MKPPELTSTRDWMSLRWRQLPPFWRGHLAGWAFVFVLILLSRVVTFRDFWIALQLTIVLESVSFFVAAGLRNIYRRRGLDTGLTMRSIVWALLLSLVAGLVQASIAALVIRMFGTFIPDFTPTQRFLLPAFYYFAIFAGWSLAYFWVVSEQTARMQMRRAVQAEADALRAELIQLRTQLDPHFLFNALNGIAAEIPQHPRAALDMVRELAAFLRHSLTHRDNAVSPLGDEVDALTAYLNVQKARFGDKLECSMSASSAALARETPGFLLQPLVENAVKHGFRTGGTPLTIRVAADVDDGALRILVSNSGHLSPGVEQDGPHGLGLANIRRRLELHYPGRHGFAIREADGMVTAELILRGRPWSA